MKAKAIFALSLLSLPCVLCNEFGPQTNQHRIDFKNMSVGQSNSYIKYRITNNTSKAYESDKLFVEVMASTDSGFILYEYCTDGHFSKNNETKYRVQVRNDSLIIDGINAVDCSSQLFGSSVSGHRIPLRFSGAASCPFDSISPRYCLHQPSGSSRVTDVRLKLSFFDTLGLVLHNEAIPADGHGYAFMVSDSLGLVFTMVYLPWFSNTAHGWELQ